MFYRAMSWPLWLGWIASPAMAKDKELDEGLRMAVTASALSAEQMDRPVVGPGDAALPLRKAAMATVVRDGAMLSLEEAPEPVVATVVHEMEEAETIGPVEEEETAAPVAVPAASPAPAVPQLPAPGLYSDPGLTAALMGLTRSIDEQRMMNHVEARLADKQRLIDRLQSDVGRSLYGTPGPAPPPAAVDPTASEPEVLDGLAAPAAAPTKPPAPPVAKSPAEASARAKMRAAATPGTEEPAPAKPDPTTQAILDRLDAQQALLVELQSQKTATPASTPVAPTATPHPPVVAPLPAGASDDERWEAVESERVAMASELQALRDTQRKLQDRLEHGTAPGVPPVGPGSASTAAQGGLQPAGAEHPPQGAGAYPPGDGSYGPQPYGGGAHRPFAPHGYPPTTSWHPPGPVPPQDNAEIQALQERLQALEAEKAVGAAMADRDQQITLLKAQLAAVGAPASSDGSSAELDALRAEFKALEAQSGESGESDSETQALRDAVLATEADRHRLDALALQMQQLEQERASLASELATADEARQAELEAEREGNAAHMAALESELTRLQKRTEEMEKLYTNRYESVLAQLQPLIDSGLDVRVVAGKFKVELPSDVLFASGSATLSRKGREEVQKVAGALRPFRTMLVQVEGHTDNVPVRSFKYESNYDLAYARAKDVMNVMLEAGLDADRVSAASFGDTRPVIDNDTRASRARNRRIELNLELMPEAAP